MICYNQKTTDAREGGLQAVLKQTLLIIFILVLGSCATTPRTAQEICIEVNQKYWGQDWKKVIKLTTRAIRMEPEFPWSYSLRGVAHMMTGNYPEAIRDLNTAIALDPLFDAAYANRGIIYLKFGKFEKAEKDILRALRLNPNDVLAMVTLAEIKATKQKDTEACDMLAQAVQINFKQVSSYFLTTDIFENLLYLPCYERLISLY